MTSGRASAIAFAASLSLASPLCAQAAPGAPGPWPAPSGEQCTASTGDATEPLGRAWRAAGLDRLSRAVAHITVTDVSQQNFMSDRPYPPFFSFESEREIWFDPSTGAERTSLGMAGLMIPERPPMTLLTTEHATFLVRDTVTQPLPALHAQTVTTRPLDVWTVLHDWRASDDVKLVASCVYREHRRLVLQRAGTFGPERLYLDPKSGLPVKLDREEPHYLWGQLHVEYQYQTWLYGDGALRPGAVFRLVDGALETERIERHFAVVPADSAPSFQRPPAAPMKVALAAFLQPTPPDTSRAGDQVMLLSNRGYREGLIMVRDTVYLLDATQGEERAREDSSWIARLYPRHRAVVVVVTDLAWPHIAGVRYWVARGATIVSHETSRAMLERVVARRWTREPDLLEAARKGGRSIHFSFVPVGDSLSLAGGAVRLYPINGVASEGALMAWMPGASVLWASDYVQGVDEPALYTAEVVRAAERVGIRPRTVTAQHQPPVGWSVVEALAAKVPR